ncbi:MAG: 50S ribosomal protein L5 [Kiritimatiellaeota bacterium]|nr:50S ribosomal protein L5 [Kiritimatiellota bacterium]
MSDMLKNYNENVVPALSERLGCTNKHQVPKLVKIVISTGISTSKERDAFADAKEQIIKFAGQQPVIVNSRKNVANFKLRAGSPVGIMLTLRKSRMYEFMDRLVHNALPRVRDFRGISPKGFDGSGNYNMGLDDVSVFTEIDLDKVKYQLGINISFVTTAKTDEAAFELLKMMDMPFAEKQN